MESLPHLPDSVEVELSRGEKKEVARRLRPRAAVLHETIRTEGELELHRPAAALAWSGLAAGLSMGFSLVTMGLIRHALPDAPWRPLLVNLGYSVGFLIVIVGRQQLFTENTLTPVLPMLHNRDKATLLRMLKLWGAVLAANVVGAAAFAFVVARTEVFSPEVKSEFLAIAQQAIAGSFGLHALRGVFSGWLIALMVWLLPSVEGSRVFIIMGITWLVGVGELSHVIAGSVEVLYGVAAGAIPLTTYVGGYLLPVLFGNMLGGVSLVAALAHAQIAADASEGPK